MAKSTQEAKKKKGLIINNLKNTTPPEEAGGKTKEIAKKKTSESTYAKQRKPRIPIRSVAIVRKCVTRASYMSHTHMQRSPPDAPLQARQGKLDINCSKKRTGFCNTLMTFWSLLRFIINTVGSYNLV